MAALTYVELLLLVPAIICGAARQSDLYPAILRDYDKNLVPDETPVAVKHALYVKHVNVDEAKQQLSVIAVVVLRWRDARLSFEGLSPNLGSIMFPVNDIWLPDIVMSSAVKPENVIIAPSHVVVTADGMVELDKQVELTVFCNVTEVEKITYICELEFESWLYYGIDIDLQPSNENVTLDYYKESKDWAVGNVTVRNEVITYLTGNRVFLVYAFQIEKSEPEISSESDDVTVTDVSALPVVFLGFLTPFQFLIPLQSSARLTFDGILILTGTVISVAIYDVSPSAQLPTSVTSYCNYILTLVFLCVLLTFLNVHICTSTGKRLPVLNYLKKGLYSGANRLVFVAVPKPKDVRIRRPHVIVEHRMEDLSKDELPSEPSPKVPATNGRESEQLTEIVDILVPLAEDRSRCENEAHLRQEWLTVGLIIDRLLFVLFFLVFVFCSIGFIS